MELNQISVLSLENSPVQGISRGLVYYVHTGRNAWHSTWVTQYYPGCMHSTFESAKNYAENRRTRGTVFYIKQLPCLIFRSRKQTILVTEINNINPLSGYSINATTEEVAYGYKKIEGALNNYLKIGSPLNGVAMSFLPNSRFWNVRPGPRDSIIMLGSADPSIPIEKISSDSLKAYKSFSHGGNYYLGWSSIESEVKRLAVLQLYRMAKPNKSSKKDAQKASALLEVLAPTEEPRNMAVTEQTYDELAKAVVSLSYRDKFRLAQLLIQLARKEEEEKYPQQRVPAKEAHTPTDVLAYVAERIGKLRPSKKASLINSINAMFQFQGGISEQERDKVVVALQKRGHIKIDGTGRVSYPG